jgi:hypothetical protein
VIARNGEPLVKLAPIPTDEEITELFEGPL